MISRSVVPIGASYWPGFRTRPDSEKIFGPEDFSVPIDFHHCAPPRSLKRMLHCGRPLSMTVRLP